MPVGPLRPLAVRARGGWTRVGFVVVASQLLDRSAEVPSRQESVYPASRRTKLPPCACGRRNLRRVGSRGPLHAIRSQRGACGVRSMSRWLQADHWAEHQRAGGVDRMEPGG